MALRAFEFLWERFSVSIDARLALIGFCAGSLRWSDSPTTRLELLRFELTGPRFTISGRLFRGYL